VEALAEKITEWMLAFWDYVLTAVGPYVQVVQLGDDLGAQGGLLFLPSSTARCISRAIAV
jgi:hypothetical protein